MEALLKKDASAAGPEGSPKSLGIVETKELAFPGPLTLESGETL